MSINFSKKTLFEEQPKQEQPQPTVEKPQRMQAAQPSSFDQFDLHPQIVECLNRMGYTTPTKIQSQTLLHSLRQTDLLCLSETGSGKTLSFILPILDYILKQHTDKVPYGIALIIAPTRELCLQINEYFTRFKEAGLKEVSSLAIYGGVDPMLQVLEIAKKPNVIVATPGRILDHLNNTKGFHLKNLRFLVLDEADKLLNKDFEEQLDQVVKMVPTQRRAYLFSATLTSRVDKLQRVSLRNPVRVEVNTKYQTVSNLEQFYVFLPSQMKDCYLLHILTRLSQRKTIIFAATRLGAQRLTLLLNELSYKVQCLHGDMSQTQRVRSLQKFKQNQVGMLVCTDVAARGIDISLVELVVNYDLCDPKSYIHRVGRTARIGQKGQSISMVTQYDVDALKKIEDRLGKQMAEFPTDVRQAEMLMPRIEICHQEVSRKMKRKKKEGFFKKMNQ